MHNVGKFHQIIADFYTHLSQKLSGNSWAARTWAIVLEFTIFTEFWQDISQILQYCQGFTIYRRGRKGRMKVQEIQEGQVRLSVDVMLRLGTRWWPPICGSVLFKQLPRSYVPTFWRKKKEIGPKQPIHPSAVIWRNHWESQWSIQRSFTRATN